MPADRPAQPPEQLLVKGCGAHDTTADRARSIVECHAVEGPRKAPGGVGSQLPKA
jgi:hypothetical protein